MGADLSTQYERQESWRRWDEALSFVPVQKGQRVLDLGCGVGQMSARFAKLGADPIGVDLNEELLQTARSLYPALRFERLDLCALNSASFGQVDGIWASFVAAYFGDLKKVLAQWSQCLSPGGWMAIVEVDDLLGHTPLPPQLTQKIKDFYAASKVGGYQFECGRTLADTMQSVGLQVIHQRVLADDELSFVGPAPKEVLEAWRLRLGRMLGLQRYFGDDFPTLEKSLLASLSSPEHRAEARVFLVVAQKRANP